MVQAFTTMGLLAILLIGGEKSGEWNDWCAWAVRLADDLYDEYLRELDEEGLI